MKKFSIVLLLILIAVAGALYYYRYEIFQYSAESIIKKKLPPFVEVGRIIFDLKNGALEVKKLRIKNPEGYDAAFLAEADAVNCRYKRKSENILDGIEVTDIVIKGPVINIERLSDGRMNVNEMDRVMVSGEAAEPAGRKKTEGAVRQKKAAGLPRAQPALSEAQGSRGSRVLPEKSLSDIIKLPDLINIADGRVIFKDASVSRGGYRMTFDDINGKLGIKLSNDYRKVFFVTSRGGGVLNRDSSQRIDWIISLKPLEKDLTMSNRYEVRNLDIKLFEPYYYKYSPILIDSGRFSGTLVFDFDHGQIGSINTLVVRGLRFREKSTGGEFWSGVSVSDVLRYLRSAPDEVIFDFKIKGRMDNLKFFPGPHVEKAIQSLVVEKITEAFGGEEGPPSGGGEKSDAEMVVDALRGLLNR